MLHMEIIQERLERNSIWPWLRFLTFPILLTPKKNPETALVVNNPTDLPEPSKLDHVEEPS
jgi:GTP-binding protein LepA